VDYVAGGVERVNERFEAVERIKRFELVPEEWTEENGLLTPTLKKRRHDIRARYEDRIEALYDDTGIRDRETTATGAAGR